MAPFDTFSEVFQRHLQLLNTILLVFQISCSPGTTLEWLWSTARNSPTQELSSSYREAKAGG